MGNLTQFDIEEWIEGATGEFHINDIIAQLQLDPSQYNHVKVALHRACQKKKAKPTGRRDGTYKNIKRYKPVNVFSIDRERKPPFDLRFPQDFNTGMEMEFAEHIVIREHDIITIGGQSNWGKTTLSLNFLGLNLHHSPVLMGNEFTQRLKDTEDFEPTQRFLNRLSNMEGIEWVDENGEDKFTLLPVREDFGENIVKDKINIIDWVNLDGSKLYDISMVMDGIKAELGRGIAIVVLQKGEGPAPRGGQFAKDFTDCELLIDKFNEYESLLTIGKVKEYTKPVMGKTFVFGISQGVKIINFREVIKCPDCYGKGWSSNKPCETCHTKKLIDK